MKLTFGFGTGVQEVEVPERNLIGELHANEVPLGLTGEAEVARALQEPIGRAAPSWTPCTERSSLRRQTSSWSPRAAPPRT